jgi:hypothetical protein
VRQERRDVLSFVTLIPCCAPSQKKNKENNFQTIHDLFFFCNQQQQVNAQALEAITKTNSCFFFFFLVPLKKKKKRRITITSGYMEITYQVSKSQRRRRRRRKNSIAKCCKRVFFKKDFDGLSGAIFLYRRVFRAHFFFFLFESLFYSFILLLLLLLLLVHINIYHSPAG